jgi:hypothetical protein
LQTAAIGKDTGIECLDANDASANEELDGQVDVGSAAWLRGPRRSGNDCRAIPDRVNIFFASRTDSTQRGASASKTERPYVRARIGLDARTTAGPTLSSQPRLADLDA